MSETWKYISLRTNQQPYIVYELFEASRPAFANPEHWKCKGADQVIRGWYELLKSCRESLFDVPCTFLTRSLVHFHSNSLNMGVTKLPPLKLPLKRVPFESILHNMVEETINQISWVRLVVIIYHLGLQTQKVGFCRVCHLKDWRKAQIAQTRSNVFGDVPDMRSTSFES